MSAEIEAKLDTLLNRVTYLDNAVADGADAELAGLDAAVQGICDEIAALPPERARELRPQLNELLEALDTLQARMRDQLEGVKAELAAHTRRSHATRAYNQSTQRSRRER